MKKGTKLAALLLGLVLIIPACGGKTPSKSSEQSEQPSVQPSDSGEQPVNYTVSITNKAELTAEWRVGDPSRKVNIETNPKANIAQLVAEGKIQITSSDPSKLSIAGQMASPLAAGAATITVKCGESQDTVDVTLQAKQSNKEKFEIEHEGTAEDPLTNEDAIKVTKSSKYNNEDLYVKGEIESFYHSPGERIDGAVSWYLKPAAGSTEKFEVYKCYKDKEQKVFLTWDDVWPGGIATAHGTFTKYGTQCETTSAIFVKCEGEKPQPREEIEATVAEALTAGKALADGASSWDYYIVTGYVVKKSGSNFFMADTTEVAADDKNMLELYGVADDILPKLGKNAKVTIKMILKNYHNQVENGVPLVDDDVTVVTEGGEWIVVPEPAVEERSLADFIAGENTKAVAYKVSAVVKGFKNGGTEPEQYGNLVLTDGTNDLTIYGSTETASALAWNDADAYVFTNPKDFLTGTLTKTIAIGKMVEMKLIRADYNSAIQGTGIVLSVSDVTSALTLALDQDTLSLAVGGTATLVATTYPTSFADSVEWSTSDDTVATVAAGVVTAVGAGTATITATSGSLTKTCAVTVVSGEIHATAVELNKSSGSLIVGQTETLTATPVPADTTDTLSWESTNTAVATVEGGVVTAVAAGNATIKAIYGEAVGEFALTVEALTAANAYVGANVNITGKVVGKNAKNVMVDDGTAGLWAFNNAGLTANVGDMVTVTGLTKSYNGGLEVDAAVLTATIGDVTTLSAEPITEAQVAAELAAYAANNQYMVSHRKVSLRTGIIGGSGEYLTWSYGESLMETSISTGNMQAGKAYDIEGYLVNFYKPKNSTDVYLCICVTSATVVPVEATGIALNKDALELEEGYEETLVATLTPADATTEIVWSSSDDTVASVDQTGKVTAVAAGTATITATAGELTATCTVTITASSGGQIPVTTTLQYSGSSTTNMTATGNAATVGLDASLFAVDADKGETTNMPGLNKAGDIRLYSLKSASATGHGSYFVVTLTGGIIKSITINFKQNASDAVVYAGSEVVTGTNGTYTIENASFKVENGYKSDGSANTQVQINSISITYVLGGGSSTPEATPLPIDGQTKVVGADMFIYLQAGSGLTEAIFNAATKEVLTFTVETTESTPTDVGAENYVTGGSAAVVLTETPFQLAYANETGALFYVHMDKGLADAWNMKHTITIKVTIGETVYQSSLVFIGNVLAFVDGVDVR